MACEHKCPSCTKTTPDAHETKDVDGVMYQSTRPRCHPRSDETPFQLGESSMRTAAYLQVVGSRTERVSGCGK